MSTPVNPYTAPANFELMLVEDASMKDSTFHSGSSSATVGGDACDPPQGNYPKKMLLIGVKKKMKWKTPLKLRETFSCHLPLVDQSPKKP